MASYFYPRFDIYNLTDYETNQPIICLEGTIPHYLNLHVPPTASYSQIAASYRAHIRALHPDKLQSKNATQTRDAVKAYDLVRQAWATLGNSEARKAYTFHNVLAEKDGKCKGWVMGREKTAEQWNCLEQNLNILSFHVKLYEGNRRAKIRADADAETQNGYGDNMEEVWKEERKPWFSTYTTKGSMHPQQYNFCTASWVNMVHLGLDNVVPTKWSDSIWRIIEDFRDVGESREVRVKTLEFWEGCDVYKVDVKMKEKQVKLPWSTLRSDTRWSTLGELHELFCFVDFVAVVWLGFMLGMWVGRKMVKILWRILLGVLRRVEKDGVNQESDVSDVSDVSEAILVDRKMRNQSARDTCERGQEYRL